MKSYHEPTRPSVSQKRGKSFAIELKHRKLVEPEQDIDNAKLNRDEQIVRHIYAQSVEKRLSEQKHSFFRGHESQIANLLKGQ